MLTAGFEGLAFEDELPGTWHASLAWACHEIKLRAMIAWSYGLSFKLTAQTLNRFNTLPKNPCQASSGLEADSKATRLRALKEPRNPL